MIKNQTVLRNSFWATYTEFTRIRGKSQNDYPADVRMAFVDYVDSLVRTGQISESLAARATL